MSNFVFLRSVRRLLVTASFVPGSPILVTVMKEALNFSETSVLTRAHGVTSQKTPFFFVSQLSLKWFIFFSADFQMMSRVYIRLK
jgi:hypothetical protein